MIPPYPLAWPAGLPRSRGNEPGKFKATLPQAIENVEDSLRRFASDTGQKVSDVSVTSMKAGLTNAQPADKGVAVWFEWDGEQRCIAIDRYDTLAGNVQAIHHIIEARRTELRHGGLNIVRQTFKGFTALPAPVSWREVLGFTPGEHVTEHQIELEFRELAKERHPDKPGGSGAKMAELNQARALALAEVRGRK